MSGYVYVIGAGDDLYKIGATHGPVDSRLQMLQIGSPATLSVALTIEVGDPRSTEKELHRRFRPKHVRGEWFRLDSDDLEAIRRAGETVPGWADLVRLEPRLAGLLAEAKAVRATDPGFCANAVFFGYDADEPSMKSRLSEMVGWVRRHPVLGTEQAYDIAYETVYEALPNCRECSCP